MNRLGSEAALQIVDIHRADTAGQHADCAYRYAEFDEVQKMMQKVLDEQACFSVKSLAINGNDVLAKGLRGKQVGEALQRTLNAVMDGEVPNEKNELLIFVDRILEEYMEDYRKMSE